MRWGQCLCKLRTVACVVFVGFSYFTVDCVMAVWWQLPTQSQGGLGVCGINRPTFQIWVLWSVRHVQQDMREDMLTSVVHQLEPLRSCGLSAFDTPISSMMGCFSSRDSLSSLASIWYVWFLSNFQLVNDVFCNFLLSLVIPTFYHFGKLNVHDKRSDIWSTLSGRHFGPGWRRNLHYAS